MSADRSGQDLDIWGGTGTRPVLLPGPGVPCVAADEAGRCPPGCRRCVEFAEQMDRTDRSGQTDRTDHFF